MKQTLKNFKDFQNAAISRFSAQLQGLSTDVLAVIIVNAVPAGAAGFQLYCTF